MYFKVLLNMSLLCWLEVYYSYTLITAKPKCEPTYLWTSLLVVVLTVSQILLPTIYHNLSLILNKMLTSPTDDDDDDEGVLAVWNIPLIGIGVVAYIIGVIIAVILGTLLFLRASNTVGRKYTCTL